MRNQRSPLSLPDRYDNLQIYCQEMREHVQELEYELSQAHNELRYLHVEIPPERHAVSAIGGIGFPMGTARLSA